MFEKWFYTLKERVLHPNESIEQYVGRLRGGPAPELGRRVIQLTKDQIVAAEQHALQVIIDFWNQHRIE